MLKRLVLGSLLWGSALVANAGPIRFEFAYAEPEGSATASGYIVLESTEIANPGRNVWTLPSPAVLDLSITIVGAAAGNGTFDETDFVRVWFDTNGGTLDFSRSLMGQPTNGLPWGTPPTDGGARGVIGSSGDFNLFVSGMERAPGYPSSDQHSPTGGGAIPPNGVWYYTLGANGGSSSNLVLTAFGSMQGHAPVPSNSIWMLVLLGVLLGATAWYYQRR